MSDYVGIIGRWSARAEGPAELARHLARCLAGLVEVDPVFRQWRRLDDRSRSAVPAIVTLPPNEAELQSWVAENPQVRAKAGRKQKIGHFLNAEGPRGKPLWTRLMVAALDGGEPSWFDNRVTITLWAESGHETLLAPLVRPVLLTLATGFACDWAGAEAAYYATPAGPQRGDHMVRYESGGLVYLAARLAEQINPLAEVETEHLASGALLMTAAAVFGRKNPQHLAAAHRIQKALAPLNGRSPASDSNEN